MEDTDTTNDQPCADIPQSIDEIIAEVAAEIAVTGVGKDGKNIKQDYSYRRLDDVFNCVGPIMARHGLINTVEFAEHKSEWRATRAGGDLEFVTVTGRFIYRWKGQYRVTQTIGKAMDSSDKATNKAMAAATKYAHTLTFNIPIIGADDGDAYGEPEGTKAAVEKKVPASMPQSEIDDLISEFNKQGARDELANKVSTALSIADKKYGDKAAFETLRVAANKRREELVAARKQQVQA